MLAAVFGNDAKAWPAHGITPDALLRTMIEDAAGIRDEMADARLRRSQPSADTTAMAS